ncbi:hypothetical protein H4Q26_004620 [Puccinia striiformis f. sp. tritici PST-130]|nr:hypothetical protein H4Q26_004620 [Puccinia striiformis f. sp. tritici PST-130]
MDAFHAERDRKAQLQKEQQLEAEAATARRKEALYHSQMPSNWDKVYPVSPSSSDSESNASGSSSPPNKSLPKAAYRLNLHFNQNQVLTQSRNSDGNSTENLDDPDAEGETMMVLNLKTSFLLQKFQDIHQSLEFHRQIHLHCSSNSDQSPCITGRNTLQEASYQQQIANQEGRPAQQKKNVALIKSSYLPVRNESGCLFRSGTPFLPDDVVTHINKTFNQFMVKKGGRELYFEYSIHSFSSAWNGNILGVSDPMALLTQEMVNMPLIEASRKKQLKVPSLTSYVGNHIAPTTAPIKGLIKPLIKPWAITKMAEQGNQWHVQKLDNSGVHAAHYMFQASYHNLMVAESGSEASNTNGIFLLVEHFCGAMAGLAYLCSYSDPGGNKNLHERAQSQTIAKQLCMLAGLLVFGPNASFTSTPSDASHGNASVWLNLAQTCSGPNQQDIRQSIISWDNQQSSTSRAIRQAAQVFPGLPLQDGFH